MLLLAFCSVWLGASATAQEFFIIKDFDAPHAGTNPTQGTFPGCINRRGAITGWYEDASSVNHGFLRAPYGRITLIDDPKAGGYDTVPIAINPAGVITGWYWDALAYTDYGFLRTPDGTFTTFDYEGLVSWGESINPAGWIAGNYYDDNAIAHGLLRAPDGTLTSFDAASPVLLTEYPQGTWCISINPAGAIVGYYTDASDITHGFVRTPAGTSTLFDASPGVSYTAAYSINPQGVVTGPWQDASGVYHGFVRTPDGVITTIEDPHAGTSPGQGTVPQSINATGEIVGYYTDANNVSHGFLRSRHGHFVTFDAPRARRLENQGTFPTSNNTAGVITGYYQDKNDVYHGFVAVPFP
jgi:hypothetical protein